MVIDFSKSRHPFNIKSESSYDAYLSEQKPGNPSALFLGIKKTNCIAYIDIPENDYQDNIIEAKISLDSMGGYGAAGVIFRLLDQESYYLALVSSKGYFRFDAVKDGAPRNLIAWTEVSDFNEKNIDIKIISSGTYFIFIVNGKWVAEINDESVPGGILGFAAASYEQTVEESRDNEEAADENREYTLKAYLEYFAVDTRVKSIEQQFKFWTSDENINAEERLKLAETFAVMDKPAKAMDQINKAWKKRDDVIRGIATAYTEARTKKELLLAARMSFRTGQFNEALVFINSIIDQWPDTPEGKLAYGEKIRILNELDKFEDLKEFLQSHAKKLERDVNYYTMLARCCSELKEYKNSAKAWKEAFKLNGENGVYAANAADSLEQLGKKEEAAALFLEAGKIFLRQDNNAELEALIPKLKNLDGDNWEVCALAGKWHYSIEDYENCEKEFKKAEKLRIGLKPKPKADPAVFYLWGMVNYLKGKKKEAVRLLERAVKLAPDFELFSSKLEEIKITSDDY